MPLIAPASYTFDLSDPSAQLRSNLDFATGLIGAQQKNQLFGMQLQQAQLQQQQQQDLRTNLNAVAQNPTPDAIARLMVVHPELSENLKRVHDTLDASEQHTRVSQLSQIHAALLSKAPDVALDRVNTLATAYENSGRPQDAKDVRGIGELIKTNPQAAIMSTGAYLAAQDPAKYAENFKTFTLLPDEQRKGAADADTAVSSSISTGYEAANKPEQLAAALAQTRAQTSNIGNEITNRNAAQSLAEKKFGLEKDKNAAEIRQIDSKIDELPPELAKEANGHVDAADSARLGAQKASSLASQIRQRISTSGGVAAASEFIKGILGDQGAETRLRQEYKQLITDQTLSSLKGLGKISVVEFEAVKGGFPSSNANPELMANALDVVAKAKALEADTRQAKAEWMAANRGNLAAPAKSTFQVAGRYVLPGDKLNAVMKLTPQEALERARLKSLKEKS
jgi:hypothetical protein